MEELIWEVPVQVVVLAVVSANGTSSVSWKLNTCSSLHPMQAPTSVQRLHPLTTELTVINSQKTAESTTVLAPYTPEWWDPHALLQRQACSAHRGIRGPFQQVFAQAPSASQTTASRKAANHEQSQQPDVTTAETSELTFWNQPDKFFVKPKQSSASRKSFWTDSVLPICKSHAVLRTSLKDVFANFNIMIKVYIILGQVLCRQPGSRITCY